MGKSVEISEIEQRCGTYLISEGFGRRHNKILELIDNNIDLFFKLGGLVKGLIKTKGRPIHEYKLNHNQIMFLLSILRGTGPVLKLKCEVVKAGNIISVLKAINDFDFGDSSQRFVYAAQDDRGNIKIGISNNPEKRVKALNIGSPFELKLIFTREARLEGYKDEALLHGQCEKYNIRSEWFASEAVELLN